METFHADDSPLAAYLQGNGSFEPETDDSEDGLKYKSGAAPFDDTISEPSFAPSSTATPHPRIRIPHRICPPGQSPPSPQSILARAHDTCSTAWNSRLGRADNEKFLEHFRYTIVASQLLNEYLDHGTLNPTSLLSLGLDGTSDDSSSPTVSASIYGAAATAAAALALVYLLQWSRTRSGTFWTKSKVTLVVTLLVVVAFVGYQYGRRQWLRSLRRQAVRAASELTTNWQSFELSTSSALSFIQEVELVSKGYRLSTPLPPVSRIENGGSRRCPKLRRTLHKTYASIIPVYIEACSSLRPLIEDDDLEKYLEVYDMSTQDAKDASSSESSGVLENDPESLPSLRVWSYRTGILRRVTLCSLMALEADGGKPDIHRWQLAIDVMIKLSQTITTSTERVTQALAEMDNFNIPATPIKTGLTPSREKMRSQVRKISALSSGIRGLQAKMQILREETNKSIEQSDDLTDLGPNLMAQYESIGTDLKELMHAWDMGKQSLQTNISRHERRISLASSGVRSPVSSLGGLTAVEEVDGTPDDALKVLNGEANKSNRSSMATSEEEVVFEAIAMPRQRASTSTLTREERIVKMQEERDRQAQLRAKRDANTSMLRELESVIKFRPKNTLNGGTAARVTSI